MLNQPQNIPSQVVIEDKDCPNGCIRNDEFLFMAKDRFHNLPGDYPVIRCKICELIRTNPRPTIDSLKFYYPDNYGPYLSTQIDFTKQDPPPFFRKLLKKIFDTKGNALPNLKSGKMLEIGCASGSFLNEMQNKGWKVCGIEFSESSASNAKKLGFNVHVGPLETAPDDYGNMDLITMWVVIEHLSEPQSSIKKIHGWLNEDGWLCLSTHNTGSYLFSTFKQDYYDNHIPNHLYHFSAKTIKPFLENNGFKVEKIIHNRLLQNLTGSIAFRLLSKNPDSVIAKKILNLNFKFLYVFFPLTYLLSLFGQSGRMTVWARKKQTL